MNHYTGVEERQVKDKRLGAESGSMFGALLSPLAQRFSLATLTTHVRIPLYRNAYAWLLSTGFSSALGIIYWVAAAHLYSPETVGINAALVSAMILMSGISQLNLVSALVRFIPSAGRMTARLAATSYLTASFLALLVGSLTVAVAGRVPALDFLTGDGGVGFLFVLATVVWGIFSLQDSVLTGLRATVWVPVDNIVYGLLKIVLLWLFASVAPEYGIFASWVLPVLLLILPINWLIFGRLIPQHVRESQNQVRPFQLRRLARYIGGNYLAWLFFLASARLIPVLVAGIAGASSAAYFFMAWTIASSLRLVVVNMATSLTVEAAADERQLSQQSRRFLFNMLRLFIPIVAVIVLAAPLLLRLAGSDYQEQGVTVLRLLVLSVLPAVVNIWYVSAARARQQVGRIVVVEAAIAVLALALSVFLLQLLGIAGVGVAWLAAESVVAAALITISVIKKSRPRPNREV